MATLKEKYKKLEECYTEMCIIQAALFDAFLFNCPDNCIKFIVFELAVIIDHRNYLYNPPHMFRPDYRLY